MKYIHWLTSLSRFKAEINCTDTDNDVLIESFISRASFDIENITRRKLRGRTYTEYYDGDGVNYLLTNEYPIISVSYLEDDIEREFDSTYSKSSDEYVIYKDSGKIKLLSDAVNGSLFNIGIQNIKLTYIAGYDEFELISGVNDSVKITESGGSSVVINFGSNIYTANELATAFQTGLNSGALSASYNVSYNYKTGKFTIAASGGGVTDFSLIWNYDNHSIGETIGFDTSSNETGALTYTGDYSVLGIPSDLEQATILQTLFYYYESPRGKDRFGVDSKSFNKSDIVAKYSRKDIPDAVERILRNYMRVHV